MEGTILDSIIRWTVVSVSLSLFYIVFSLGLTLTFGFHQVVNFAHGAIYMLGTFIGLFFYSLTGSFVVAIITAMLFTMLIGGAAERGIVSRLYGKDPANTFLVTFALSLALVGIVKLIAGGHFRSFPVPELLTGSISIGTVTISHYRIFFIGISILLVFLLHMLLTKTRIGVVIRAGITNRSAVEVLGINVKNYFTLLFAIGSGLAGIAGVLIAPTLSVYPGMGDDLILWAFVIVIIGGLGSFRGAILGGVLIGLLHAVGTYFIGPLVTIVTFVVLIVVFTIRPQGLLGVRETR